MNPLHFLGTLQDEVMLTVGLAGALTLATYGGTWAVSRQQSLENQRFWRLTFRHLAALAFAVSMVIIWRHQLQSSVVALGAALAGVMLTLRENWLSLAAFWVRIGRRHYGLDDFIEVDGIRGRVLDITWLTTVLAETGPGANGLAYSGRVVHVPNYRTLLVPLFVENLTGNFSAHLVTIPLPPGADAVQAEQRLLAAATAHCTGFSEAAEAHMSALQRDEALDTPSVRPKTHIRVGEEGALTLVLRIVVPVADRLRVEQDILREFLSTATAAEWPRVAA